jgi:hypothetical protein
MTEKNPGFREWEKKKENERKVRMIKTQTRQKKTVHVLFEPIRSDN